MIEIGRRVGDDFFLLLTRRCLFGSRGNCPARCSGGRRPLIAGCVSLQRLGVDLPLTKQQSLMSDAADSCTKTFGTEILRVNVFRGDSFDTWAFDPSQP